MTRRVRTVIHGRYSRPGEASVLKPELEDMHSVGTHNLWRFSTIIVLKRTWSQLRACGEELHSVTACRSLLSDGLDLEVKADEADDEASEVQD